MNDFAPIDIVLVVLGVIMILRGFVRGFIREFFSLGAPVLGLLAGFLLYKNGAAFLRERYLQDIRWLPEVLAFIAIFLVVYAVGKIAQKLLSDIIEGLGMDAVDRALGCIFGIAEGIAAISLALFIIFIQPVFDSSALLQGSFFAKIILPLIIDMSGEMLNIPLTITVLFSPGEYPAGRSGFFPAVFGISRV